MMRVGSAAEMPRGRGTNAGLFFVKLSSQPTRANCIRGNGILRPETLVRTGGSLGPETVQSPWETRPRPANLRNCRGFSNPVSSCPLGRLAGGGRSRHKQVSDGVKFPANREIYRELAETRRLQPIFGQKHPARSCSWARNSLRFRTGN